MDDNGADSVWTESGRLAALERYGIMDTPREADFDDIVKVAAQICGTSMALISLVDAERQWFKAAVGLDAPQTPREIAFCHHAIQGEGVFLVNDATNDPRFVNNPLVTGDPNLRFYAGAPLETPDGFALGTLCVLDTMPRELTAEQSFAITALARQVIIQLELRRALAEARAVEEQRKLLALELQHRIKNTLATVQAIVGQTLRGANAPADLRTAITDRLVTLGKAHDLLTASHWAAAPLGEIVEAAVQGSGADHRRFVICGPVVQLNAKAALALALGLHELITNAIKYGALSNETGQVRLSWAVAANDGAVELTMDWREIGGPPVAAPRRRGFGSRLIDRALATELNGEVRLDYPADGVVFSLRAVLDDPG